MLQKFFATGIALTSFAWAYSQDSAVAIAEAIPKAAAPVASAGSAKAATEQPAPKPLISGYVDVYYRYNFANAKNAGGTGSFNNYTSFTNSQNSFELGMVSVRLDHTIGKVSV